MASSIETGRPDFLTPKLIDKIKPTLELLDAKEKKDGQKSLDKLKDAMKEFDTLLTDLDSLKLTADFKADTAAMAMARVNALKSKGAYEGAKGLDDLFETIRGHADDLRDMFGKTPAGKAADTCKLIAKISVDGRNWVRTTSRFVATCVAKVDSENKRMSGLEDGQRPGDSPEVGRMLSRTRTALKELRASDGESTLPFLLAAADKDLFVYVSRDARGGSAEDRVKGGLGEAGKSAKIHKGDCIYLKRKIVFVSQTLSGGTFPLRIQRRLQADLGQRLPIAVSKDRTILETVDADDFDDPLEFLVAQGGPLASTAKRCLELRASIFKELKAKGILDARIASSRQAHELLDRAEAAAEKEDLGACNSLLLKIRSEVIPAHQRILKQAMEAVAKLKVLTDSLQKRLDAAQKAIDTRRAFVKGASFLSDSEKETAKKKLDDMVRALSDRMQKCRKEEEKANDVYGDADGHLDAVAAHESFDALVEEQKRTMEKDAKADEEARRRAEKKEK